MSFRDIIKTCDKIEKVEIVWSMTWPENRRFVTTGKVTAMRDLRDYISRPVSVHSLCAFVLGGCTEHSLWGQMRKVPQIKLLHCSTACGTLKERGGFKCSTTHGSFENRRLISALENGDLTLEDMMRKLNFAGGPVIRAEDILRVQG